METEHLESGPRSEWRTALEKACSSGGVSLRSQQSFSSWDSHCYHTCNSQRNAVPKPNPGKKWRNTPPQFWESTSCFQWIQTIHIKWQNQWSKRLCHLSSVIVNLSFPDIWLMKGNLLNSLEENRGVMITEDASSRQIASEIRSLATLACCSLAPKAGHCLCFFPHLGLPDFWDRHHHWRYADAPLGEPAPPTWFKIRK